jgi:hypothetical protein
VTPPSWSNWTRRWSGLPVDDDDGTALAGVFCNSLIVMILSCLMVMDSSLDSLLDYGLDVSHSTPTRQWGNRPQFSGFQQNPSGRAAQECAATHRPERRG